MPDKQKKFQQVIDVSMEFTQTRDVDLLLEKILNAVKELTNADAGSIYLLEEDTLKFHHTQNGPSQELSPGEKPHISKISSVPVNPESVSAYVARTGEILHVPEIDKLPQDVPFSVSHSFDGLAHYEVKSLLSVPLKNANEKVLGVIQLINTRNDTGEIIPLSEDDTPLVQLLANNAANAIERTLATRARVLGIIQILTALRDTEETVAHVNRVGAYASEIYETWARQKGIPPEEIASQKDILRMAAMLHDLGKLAIPNVIRRKPGKLSAEEYETMKQHTVKGAQLLLKHANSEIENVAAQIVLTHHEHWDGAGYPGHIDLDTGRAAPGYEDQQGKPRGKKGEEIPVFGRAVAIADVYDSLSNHRVYREAWKEEDVLEKLKEGAGTHFDPDMTEAFFASLDPLHAIAKRFPNQ